jgi:hypothetical protein
MERRETKKMDLGEIDRLRRRDTADLDTSLLKELLAECEIEGQVDAAILQRSKKIG